MAGEDGLKERLEAACKGLLYPSESDEPFEFVRLEGAGRKSLTAERLLAALGLDAATPVREQTVDAFFEALPEEEFGALRKALEAELRGLKVFRVGEVEVKVYVMGRAAGAWVGLRTMSVET
jgi:nuclease A inhibitor-like protein